jgi:hypothetical protein
MAPRVYGAVATITTCLQEKTAMEIVNTIGWRTPWLRRVVAYCCRELGYRPARIVKATFRKAGRAAWKGWASLNAREIRIKINPANRYPIDSRAHRGLAPTPLVDAVEVLVKLTAHEIAHLERWERFARDWRRQGRRDTFLERDTEALARGVLTAFRADRERLLAAWGEPGPGPAPPRYVYRTECPSCGSVSVRARPCRTLYCTCQGEWKRGMPEPAYLECRRVPFAGASSKPLEEITMAIADRSRAFTAADFEQIRPGVLKLKDHHVYAADAGLKEPCEQCQGKGRVERRPCGACSGRRRVNPLRNVQWGVPGTAWGLAARASNLNDLVDSLNDEARGYLKQPTYVALYG